jgi:hypothetical protein
VITRNSNGGVIIVLNEPKNTEGPLWLRAALRNGAAGSHVAYLPTCVDKRTETPTGGDSEGMLL